jgi:hypothetical protein
MRETIINAVPHRFPGRLTLWLSADNAEESTLGMGSTIQGMSGGEWHQELRTQLQEGLAGIDHAIQIEPEEWDAFFWKGMICAYLGRNLMANVAIEGSLELYMPPMLLTPLDW